MDHLIIANIDAHMRDARAVCVLEKYKITGAQIGFLNVAANLNLQFRGSGNSDSMLFEYILHISGTVKSCRSTAAPGIGDSQILFGFFNNFCSSGIV